LIFENVLKAITPTEEEEIVVQNLVKEILSIIDQTARIRNIPAQALLVGSVAKGTWLQGKADIDIFISFPLEYDEEDLKKNGLNLGKECVKQLKGEYEKRYASHPYLTGFIDNYEVDFVPCYSISKGQRIKSAVDRSILHMEYIKANLKPEDQKEVLLLKRFMQMVGTYGSEFKVGGFAGYLCELLVLHYGSFLKVLKAAAQSWNPGYSIDLEGFGTAQNFKDPLIVIDPVDENRNVASSLTLQKMSEFMIAAGNFLDDHDEAFFYPAPSDLSPYSIKKEFNDRKTRTILINFKAPKIPADALHPQIKKTEHSLARILNKEGFKLIGSDYWTDENEYAVILLELEIWKLPLFKIHRGPLVWNRAHGRRFSDLHPQSWIEDDRWTSLVERDFNKVEPLLQHLLSDEGIRKVRGGKHVKKNLMNSYRISGVEDSLYRDSDEKLKFFYNYLYKDWQLKRDFT
jgi:tRNA nucleotidyltransferase (CCA-adding enzyme)